MHTSPSFHSWLGVTRLHWRVWASYTLARRNNSGYKTTHQRKSLSRKVKVSPVDRCSAFYCYLDLLIRRVMERIADLQQITPN